MKDIYTIKKKYEKLIICKDAREVTNQDIKLHLVALRQPNPSQDSLDILGRLLIEVNKIEMQILTEIYYKCNTYRCIALKFKKSIGWVNKVHKRAIRKMRKATG